MLIAISVLPVLSTDQSILKFKIDHNLYLWSETSVLGTISFLNLRYSFLNSVDLLKYIVICKRKWLLINPRPTLRWKCWKITLIYIQCYTCTLCCNSIEIDCYQSCIWKWKWRLKLFFSFNFYKHMICRYYNKNEIYIKQTLRHFTRARREMQQ